MSSLHKFYTYVNDYSLLFDESSENDLESFLKLSLVFTSK